MLGRSKGGGPRGIWTVFGVEESIFAGFEPQMDGFEGLWAIFETPRNLADFGQKWPKMAQIGQFWPSFGLLGIFIGFLWLKSDF